MPNKREVAYNATHGRCAYCGCIINPMHFFLNQAKPGQQVAACPDCARFKGSDDLETFRARLHDLPEVSIQSRLALKYSDSILNPEEPIKEGYYHGFGKICFYFENMDEQGRHPYHHYGPTYGMCTVWIHLSESGTGGGKDYIKLNLRRRNVKVTIK